jgi:Sulfotransferase family
MIISFRHNFIYFRPMKTGSSTIEAVLCQSLGPDDIIAGRRALRVPGRKSTAEIPENLAAHSKPKDILNIVSWEFWQGCYRFASERHPYEKAVSFAYFQFGRRQKKDRAIEGNFSKFLDKTVHRGLYRGFDYYSIDGQSVVSDFIRHETLQEDFKRIGAQLGITIPDELPQKKAAHRTDRRPARDILSEEQKRIVFAKCREEFELLGYEP